MELLGEDSVVLVTNYHVIISGLSESYEKAKEVSEDTYEGKNFNKCKKESHRGEREKN